MMSRTFFRCCLVMSMLLPASVASVASADVADPPSSPSERRAPPAPENAPVTPDSTGKAQEPNAPLEPTDTQRVGGVQNVNPFGDPRPVTSITIVAMCVAAGLWIGRKGLRTTVSSSAT